MSAADDALLEWGRHPGVAGTVDVDGVTVHVKLYGDYARELRRLGYCLERVVPVCDVHLDEWIVYMVAWHACASWSPHDKRVHRYMQQHRAAVLGACRLGGKLAALALGGELAKELKNALENERLKKVRKDVARGKGRI